MEQRFGRRFFLRSCAVAGVGAAALAAGDTALAQEATNTLRPVYLPLIRTA